MAYERESREARALTTIDSSKYPDTNKDLARNVMRLNSHVDYMASYMRIMQKGIDDANKNFLEQIQDFIADIFVLLAGGEPTGIEFGDLKYILQAIGALFGFGDQPFPINLLNVAQHFFLGYVVPLEQFTDVIFDTIIAWLLEFGFSEDFVESIRDFQDAIEEFAEDFGQLVTSVFKLFDIFGFLGFGDSGGTNEVQLVTITGNPDSGPFFLSRSGDETTPIPIDATPKMVKDALVALPSIGAGNVGVAGDPGGPWQVVFRNKLGFENVGLLGSRHEFIGGTAPDVVVTTQVQGSSAPFSILWEALEVFFDGLNTVILRPIIDLISAWGVPFVNVLTDIINALDAFIDIINGQAATHSNPIFGFLQAIFGMFDLVGFLQDPLDAVGNWVKLIFDVLIPNGVLGINSPLDVLNLFGQIPRRLFGLIPLQSIVDDKPNLLTAGTFKAAANISGSEQWVFDKDVTRSPDGTGSVRTTANGMVRALRSNIIPVGTTKTLDLSVWVMWSGYSGSGNPIRLEVVTYQDSGSDQYIQNGVETIDSVVSPAAASGGWVELSGTWTDTPEVDAIAMRLVVDSTAAAGTVWFDDAVVQRNGYIQQGWVNGLVDFVEGIFSIFTGNPLNGLNELGEMWNNFLSLFNIPTPEELLSGVFDLFGLASAFMHNILNPLGFFANLVGGKLPNSQAPNIVSDLQSAMNQIGDIFKGNIVDPIFDFVSDVADWFLDFLGFKDDTIINQTIQQNFTISATSSAHRQPAWVSPNSIAAVSYPAILNSRFLVYTDTVGPATAGTAHSHEIRGGTDNARAIAPWWSIDPDGSRGAFVTVEEDCIFTGFGFVGYAENPVANNSDLVFELFREEPTGTLNRLTSSNVGQFFSTTQDDIMLTWTDFKVVARRGERYLLRIKNLSNPDCVPRLKGLRWDIGTPEIQWSTNNLTDTQKTTYTGSEVDAIQASSAVIPWFILKTEEDDIPESRTWADSFERDELGYFWYQRQDDGGGDMVIVNNRLTYGGTTNGFQQVMYIRPLATDRFKVDAELVGLNNTAAISIFAGSGRSNTYGVILSVKGNLVQLSSNVNNTITVRDSVSRTDNNGTWTLQATESAGIYTYTALLNGDDVGLSWTDSGSLLPKGVQFRYGQIQIQRTSGINGGQVVSWKMQDWV